MRRRTIFIIIFIILVIIASVSSVYFLSMTSHDVVTLLADDAAIKKKPKDPGGLVIPNSDSLVYETLKGSNQKKRKVNLLPEPEEPMEISRRKESSAKILDSIDEILDNIEYYETEYIAAEQNSNNVTSNYIVPNILLAKEEKKPDDKTIYVPGTSLNIMKALDDSLKIKNYQIVADEDLGYKIQLSSSYSQSDATLQWQKIRQKHRKILGEANLIIKKIEGKNERIFFLVMAGSYPSLSHAKLVCKKLAHRRQNCIVTK